MSETLRSALKSALTAFATQPLREASLGFFKTLGYSSQRTVIVPKSAPRAFFDLFAKSAPFDQEKALFADWLAADLLFQLTDQELSREVALFPETGVSTGQLRSYIFFTVELKDRTYPRGKLANLARQLNRLFPTPVMVLIKHRDLVSLAVINRRPNKLDQTKDVLGRVTLIRNIALATPHRGHLDILVSLATSELEHPEKKPITDFDTLHAAWEQIFNVELLNARFYRELANWYFWALPQVEFPADLEPDSEKRRATGLIRLLTRLIFCWFLKEKDLVPEKLFHPADLARLLKGFDPESETSSTYYQAILQNLFFATLNQRMGKARAFIDDEDSAAATDSEEEKNKHHYSDLFDATPDSALALFADVPFLNGGLFECLDRTEEGTDKKRYLDGFSRNPKKRPHVPDRIFFDSGETADLTEAYGDKKRKAERVTGLIHILNRYKFTIVENTPIDQEIALDPELLGKVFENLLASYNEETKTTARKQTGSFYTPRPIVDYMVDESLKAHLTRVFVEKTAMSEAEARAGLDLLFAYTEKEHAFTVSAVAVLIAAIDALKILDPACGSGAFPMGVLHKLVYILGKVDPNNKRWIETQLAKLDSPSMREELERAFAENNDDYGRKLSLIENCLYGVDIQPIAIQITKLRFFISLVADQKTSRDKAKNLNIKPLPNLETKFVAADTLVGLPEMTQSLLVDPRVGEVEKEIEVIYHSHFSEQRRDRKLAGQRKVKSLRQELAKLLSESLMAPAKAKHIAEWDAFDPQASADFFDPHWMFGRSLASGFDIIIGNPPYLASYSRESVGMTEDRKAYFAENYSSTSGRINTFIIFTERSSLIVKKSGHVSFIVPKPFLMMTAYQKTRQMLANLSLVEIVDCREEVFTGACVPTCIFLFQHKKPSESHAFNVFEYGKEGFRFLRRTPNAQILNDSEFRINVTASEGAQVVLQHLLKTPTTLNDFCFVEDGINPGPFREWLVTTQKVSDKCVKLIEGRNFNRYLPIMWAGKWFLWDKSSIKVRQKDVPNSIAVLGDESRFLSGQKIVTRQTADGIIATLDRNQYFSTNSVHTTRIRPDSLVNLNYILGVLNSGLIRFFFRNQFKEKENAFPQVKVNKLRKIPIPRVDSVSEGTIAKLVDCILFEKANMPTSSIAAFIEDLIDACVLECYFREHMAERDLLFIVTVSRQLSGYESTSSAAQQREFLDNLHQTLNAPKHPIRNRLLRLTADSPDLLAVIKAEGRA